MTEATLQDLVIDTAQWLGYLIHHDRPARTADGSWVTHIQGDTGFPDLVLTHKRTHTTIFAELKSDKGRLTPEQTGWLTALGGLTNPDRLQAGGRGVYLWTPTDWDPNGGQILERLTEGAGKAKETP